MPPPQDLKTAIERIRSTPFPDNERAVEHKVITPILSALGWDMQGDEVRYQYEIGGTRSREQGVVDIALFGARGALCLIEAKNTDEKLDKHVSQLLGYAFYEGVVLCVLTNGREWWLYLPREVGKPVTRKFSELNLETDTLDALEEQMFLFLNKKNLESGKAEKAGKERLLDKRERDIWKQMLEQTDKDLVETITLRIEQETGIRPSQSRVAALLSETRFEIAIPSSVSNLIKKEDRKDKSKQSLSATSKSSLPSAKQFDVETTFSGTAMRTPDQREVDIPFKPETPSLSEAPREKPKRKQSPSVKIYGVRLWGQFEETRRWADAYILLANELYTRHPDKFFETVSSLKGTTYPWFAYTKEACSTPDSQAKFLEDSDPRIYAFSHGSADFLMSRAKRLLKTFGYPSEDTDIWEIVTE